MRENADERHHPRVHVAFDLEDRLVDFACMCLDICDLLPHTKAGQNLEFQLSKSGTAPQK